MPEVRANDPGGNAHPRRQSVLPMALTESAENKRLASNVWLHSNHQEHNSYERVLGKLVAELGQTREKERQKIANHLHDEIGQNLILATIKLGRLEVTAPKRQAAMIREIHELITSVIHETRSLLYDLNPQPLRDLGLRAALDWLIERTRVNYGLRCAAELKSVPEALPEEMAETIFYVVRELLINIAKHAEAKQARLIFRSNTHRLLIQVIDDGQGFEASRFSPLDPASGGFGLLSIRERLSSVGGSMYIDSHPGGGTNITLTLPKPFDRES
jgi:signal transduction histidine kinase